MTFVDAIAKDGVALPAAGLSVGEEGGVEPVPRVVQDTAPQVLEHLTQPGHSLTEDRSHFNRGQFMETCVVIFLLVYM